VAGYLARFKGSSREHTESDLRCYLAWCAERGLDPSGPTGTQVNGILFVDDLVSGIPRTGSSPVTNSPPCPTPTPSTDPVHQRHQPKGTSPGKVLSMASA
jgi:hypothetical protein